MVKRENDQKDPSASVDDLVSDGAPSLYRFLRTVHLLWREPEKLVFLMNVRRWQAIVSPVSFYAICIALAGVTWVLAEIISDRSLRSLETSWPTDLSELFSLLLGGVPFMVTYHYGTRIVQRLVHEPPVELRTSLSSWCYLGGLIELCAFSIVGIAISMDHVLHDGSAKWAAPTFLIGAMLLALPVMASIHNRFLKESVGTEGPVATLPALLIYCGFLTVSNKVLGW